MRPLATAELQDINGGGWGDFFAGVACGASAAGATAAWLVPELGISKYAAYNLTLVAIGTCGALLS